MTFNELKPLQAGVQRPRRLLLCLDGVPFKVISEAKSRGLFDAFNDPSRLLSPFPTMTNVALSAMLGSTAPLGYESLYFDRNVKELRGGVRKYIGWRTPDKVPSSYMDKLDYQEPLACEFLVYVAPGRVWRADLRRFHDRFRSAPPDRDFFGFLKGTDGLLHIRGREQLDRALESLDKTLTSIRQASGSETEIVLFSDHGMNLQENKRVMLKTHLRKRGFPSVSNLANGTDNGVVIPAFGLCGYAALYCRDLNKASSIADHLRDLEGVDFSVHKGDGESVWVKGSNGTARIHRRVDDSRVSYAYELVQGDPLLLSSSLKLMNSQGKLTSSGFALDSAWFEELANHIYPDALSNIYQSIRKDRVCHTADVLVSFKDGYYYGHKVFSSVVRLLATHGNALAPSTNAFLMSTHRSFAAAIRADDAGSDLLA